MLPPGHIVRSRNTCKIDQNAHTTYTGISSNTNILAMIYIAMLQQPLLPVLLTCQMQNQGAACHFCGTFHHFQEHALWTKTYHEHVNITVILPTTMN